MNVIKGKPGSYLSEKKESSIFSGRPEAAAELKMSLHPILQINLLYFYSIAPPLSMRCGLFSEAAETIFLLTAERNTIINCAYTQIALYLVGNCIKNALKKNTGYLLSAVAVIFRNLYKI
jgi:hypothetical protein